MKHKRAWMAGAAALMILCIIAGWGLLRHAQPTQTAVSYDLSLGWTGEAMPEGWVYNQKGWQVFVQVAVCLVQAVLDLEKSADLKNM